MHISNRYHTQKWLSTTFYGRLTFLGLLDCLSAHYQLNNLHKDRFLSLQFSCFGN